MELDDDAVEGGQGVVQRPRVVGEGPGVDDDGGGPAPGAVDELDELAFVVGLVVLELEAAAAGLRRWRPPRGRPAWRVP